MQAIGYVRVSTEEQAAEGVSLAAQRAKLTAYATLKGAHLVEVVEDVAVSGGKPLAERPGGKRLTDAIRRREVDAVLVVKLDRAFRDCADCLSTLTEWDKRGAALHILDLGGNAVDTTSAAGRFMLTVLAGAAEMERNLIRERTSAAMQYKKAAGEYTGGTVPYGFTLSADGVTLTEDATEQRVLVDIAEFRERGYTLRAVAAELNSREVAAKRGGKWYASSVRAVLAA
ncbi:MAG: DNA invertase Pin [Armatimonadetes bacterium CG_4_10_14_0_8_um_filter_66_14]|nr:MAG: DNA invertase Pin [Armatimonadetes bacterium CG_4_10_14_0_8_um_filter_66_14]